MQNKRKKLKRQDGLPEYILTYADIVTLLLVFFVTMFSLNDFLPKEDVLKIMSVSFMGSGFFKGGKTLDLNQLSYLSNNFMTLPSFEKNKKSAQSSQNKFIMIELMEKIKSKNVTVRKTEKGVLISLFADAFFDPASAKVKLDKNREIIQKISSFLSFLNEKGYNFKIEGHTDNIDTDINGPWKNNWELSTARAVNMLEQILNYSSSYDRKSIENKFEVSGFGGMRPILTNDTPEGRAYNRRVDILITSDANLSTPNEIFK